MQHFILNRKILELERNKEMALAIPVLFNTGSSEFLLEISEDTFKEEIKMEFSLYRSKGQSPIEKIVIAMTNPTVRFTPIEISDLEAQDYLLYSCKANYSMRLNLSIIAN